MKIHSQSFPAAHAILLGFAQDLLQRISAAAAERRVRRQRKTAAEALQQMDLRLLDDIGVTSRNTTLPLEQLAKMNPAVLAASIFSAPRSSR